MRTVDFSVKKLPEEEREGRVVYMSSESVKEFRISTL
jgi:hypothetical protein